MESEYRRAGHTVEDVTVYGVAIADHYVAYLVAESYSAARSRSRSSTSTARRP
jgi:hypothetical protein